MSLRGAEGNEAISNVLSLGDSNFEFVWDLGFVAWDLSEKEVMKWQKR
jgi:hypothetical protein